jgi:hypothetical protein
MFNVYSFTVFYHRKMKICVVYLCWLPYGIELLEEFIGSYKKFHSGYEHELVVLFNGLKEPGETEKHRLFLKNENVTAQFFHYNTGHDLEAYHWVAEKLSCDYILFLNSYSRLLADDWLEKFVQVPVSKPKVKLVGATGSWQSLYSRVFENNSWKWTSKASMSENITKYKLMVKAFFLWRWYFSPFPNPHIRTNGFFISRDVFLAINYKNPVKKFDAYRIESGRNSITNQTIRLGYEVAVVDRFGLSYTKEEWKMAKVFWSYGQENLLISDNQTRMYEQGSKEMKSKLSYSAWRLKDV